MTTHSEVVLGQKLFLGDVMPESDTVSHYQLVWILPDTRLIVGRADQTPGIAVDQRFDVRPEEPDAVLIFWGAITDGGARVSLGGEYLPYTPADGIPVSSDPNPVNQIPHQRDFLNHCCTFAHEVLSGHEPHATRLRHVDSWNLAPDIALDVDSIERNRVGMRYYRGVLGYFYDRIVRFSSHPNDNTNLSQFETDWRTELQEMQDIDRYVCGECRDEAGASRLRDFIHYCNVPEWDNAYTAVEQLAIGSSIQYRARLPKIDRSNPDDLRPHTRQNVRDWVTNVPSVDSGWRSMMRDFDAAVQRYDRDPSVRMVSGTHSR